jgi:hypothetical protein
MQQTIEHIDSDECTREDLRVEISVCVDVDDDGEPITDVSMEWDVAGDEPYWCSNCSESFKHWEWALEHLQRRGVEK